MAELSLFFSAFLAATILPFSSEAALIIALANDMTPLSALVFASVGNVLAISLNYLLGYLLYTKYHSTLHRSKVGRYALHVAHTHPNYALLFSWVPLLGDPITIASGLLRINFYTFFFVASILRILRYCAIIYLY